MAIESLKCPECGAPLHFDNEDQEFCFCSHCGVQVQRTSKNKKTTVVYRKIDEARIKEAEIQGEIKKQELENENKAAKNNMYIALGGVLISFLCIALLLLMWLLR